MPTTSKHRLATGIMLAAALAAGPAVLAIPLASTSAIAPAAQARAAGATTAAADPSSGQPTGKRSHQPL
jgi:hypothetical protein